MFLKTAIFTLFSTCLTTILFSQTELGFLPKMNLSYQLSKNIKTVAGIESRQFIYEEQKFSYRYALTDFQFFVSYKLSPAKSLNTGITFRNRESQDLVRISQQYSVVKKFDAYRIGHRFGMDVTWGAVESAVVRSRYRLTYEKPLAGDRVDPSEFYLKLGSELLLIFDNETKVNLENRLLSSVGYEINYKNRIETGMDFRLREIIEGGPKYRAFWLVTWYFSI